MAETVLDVTGLNCPLPLLRAEKIARGLADGAVLRVLTTDPGAADDFNAYCTKSGHDLLKVHEAGGVVEITIRIGT